MGVRVSNAELLKRCYMRTHEAADLASELQMATGRVPDAARLTRLRNTLRDALCAVQEVKTRVKTENKTNQ